MKLYLLHAANHHHPLHLTLFVCLFTNIISINVYFGGFCFFFFFLIFFKYTTNIIIQIEMRESEAAKKKETEDENQLAARSIQNNICINFE